MGSPDVRRRGTVTPLVFDSDEEEPFGVTDAPFAGGNMNGLACEGVGVGACPDEAVDAATVFCGETAGKGTRCDNVSVSSPTRRLFVSVLVAGDNLMVGGSDRVPNDGDW